MMPIPAKIDSGLWYQYYFQTERGQVGLAADRRGVARVIWPRNSPSWRFDEATFECTAMAFDNPDYIEVVIHSYRLGLGLARAIRPMRRSNGSSRHSRSSPFRQLLWMA